MVKVVVTRNFKEENSKAKYCVAKFGEDPANARELESVDITNARIVHASESPELRQFQDFGCGVLVVGFAEENIFPKERIIHFNGHGFSDTEGDEIDSADMISFREDKIVAYGINKDDSEN